VRVRCVALQYRQGGPTVSDASGWLTIGREYVVLSIECSARGGPHFRVLTDEDDRGFGLFPSTLFEITDPRLSARWHCAADAGGSVSIAPPAWLSLGFWDRFFGDDPDLPFGQPDARAFGIFRLETQALIAEDDDRRPG
jgi:hypothetical protein